MTDVAEVVEEVSSVPVNAMGTSSSIAGSGGIDTFDPLMTFKGKKKLRNIVKRVRGDGNDGSKSRQIWSKPKN